MAVRIFSQINKAYVVNNYWNSFIHIVVITKFSKDRKSSLLKWVNDNLTGDSYNNTMTKNITTYMRKLHYT